MEPYIQFSTECTWVFALRYCCLDVSSNIYIYIYIERERERDRDRERQRQRETEREKNNSHLRLPGVWCVNEFSFSASAYQYGWPLLSLTVLSSNSQCMVNVLMAEFAKCSHLYKKSGNKYLPRLID